MSWCMSLGKRMKKNYQICSVCPFFTNNFKTIFLIGWYRHQAPFSSHIKYLLLAIFNHTAPFLRSLQTRGHKMKLIFFYWNEYHLFVDGIFVSDECIQKIKIFLYRMNRYKKTEEPEAMSVAIYDATPLKHWKCMLFFHEHARKFLKPVAIVIDSILFGSFFVEMLCNSFVFFESILTVIWNSCFSDDEEKNFLFRNWFKEAQLRILTFGAW